MATYRESGNIYRPKSDAGLISSMYKELLQLNNNKTTQLVIEQRTWIDCSKERCTMANEHMKRCVTY